MTGVIRDEFILAQQHDLGFAHVAGLLDEAAEELVAETLFLELGQHRQGEDDDVLTIRVVTYELFEFFVCNIVFIRSEERRVGKECSL